MRARELDASRLIIDEAGGFSGPCSVYLPHSREPIEINDVHMYPGAPLARARYDELLALGKTREQLAAAGLQLGRYTASHVSPGLLTNISDYGSAGWKRTGIASRGRVTPCAPTTAFTAAAQLLPQQDTGAVALRGWPTSRGDSAYTTWHRS